MAAQTEIGIRLSVQGDQQVKSTLSGVDSELARLSGSLARIGTYGASFLVLTQAIAPTVGAMVRSADAVTTLNNQLKLATGSVGAASKAYEALFDIAQRSRVGFTELGGTFASISRAGQELGLSQQRLLGVTEAVGNAMTVGGGSAQAMQAALVQLGQGLASGTLRGEELNSIMEQTPRLAKAIADGLGVPIGKLREMGAAGELSAQQVIKALESQAAVLKGEVAGATLTVGQAMTQLDNATIKAIGELDKATGASSGLASAISTIASAIGTVGQAAKENEVVIKATIGAAAAAASGLALASVAANIGKVTAAVRVLGAVMSANPYVLALMGIGAVVGGVSAAAEARRNSLEGMRSMLKELEGLEKKGNTGMYGNQVSSDVLAKRRAEIARLRTAIAELDAQSLDTRAEDARLAAHQQNAKAAAADADAYAKLRGSLSGFKGDHKEYTANLQLIQRLRDSGAISEAEASQRLTELAQKHGTVAKAVKANKDAERELLEQRKRDWEVGELRNKQIDDRLKFESELAKQQLAAVASEYQATDATNAQALARELANDKTVDATLAMQQLTLAQLEQQRLDLEATDNVIPGYIAALEARIAAQKRLIAATQTGITQDAAEKSAKDSVKAWDKASDKIGDTLTDALMRGFESGKDFAMVLRDTVVNMFKTMVLRPIIQAVINPVAGALMGSLGMAGTANAAGSALGGAALFGGASLAAIGSSIGTGIMATLTGQSVGAAAGAYSAAGMGGVSAGLSVGAAVPYIAAVLAAPAVVDALFGRKLKETGIQGTFGTAGFTGQSYRYEKGGLFRSDRTTYSAMDAGLDQGLDATFLSLRNNTAQMARDLGLASNAVDSFTTSVKLNFKGLTDKQIQEKLTKEFGKMGDAMAELVLGAGATADQLQQLYTQVMGERYQLETKLLQLQGDTVELRRRERDALHESNRALYDQITALEAMQAAVSSAVSTTLEAVSQQIGESERAASAARDAARAYGEAGTGLRETIDRLLGRADTAQGAQAAYAQALSAARGGDVSAMEALPALAEAYAAQQRASATSAVQASVASARIAAELAGVAAIADVLEIGADYQADLYDVNTAVLEVLRSELQTGNATVERLDSIKDVLTSLGGTIADSGKLTVGAVQTADGNTAAALLDHSGAVVGQLSSDTALQLLAVKGQSTAFDNSITGQTTAFDGFNQSTIAQLQSVEGVQGDVLDSTDVVAEATGGNALLSEAILKQLQTPDAGSKFLGDTISFGNAYLAGRLDGVIAAINQQSAAQQAELKRQQDLEKAQAELESIASARNLAIGQVEQGIESIWALAKKYGIYLNATTGATLLKNTAVFDVNDAGLFTSQYGQISGNTTAAASFKSAFYSTGGAYDQTYGRASELQQLAKDLEAQREAIRALGGVPAFAAGGLHSGGLRLVGENGPELEVTGPSRIFNAQQTAAMLGGEGGQAVAAEIRALREEVAMLRAEARATAVNTGKTKRILERVTRDGEAMQTEVAA